MGGSSLRRTEIKIRLRSHSTSHLALHPSPLIPNPSPLNSLHLRIHHRNANHVQNFAHATAHLQNVITLAHAQ
jgi:hypothetical protein